MGRSADIPRESGRTDGDDTGCTILHVDMDAFFASVEIRNDPELLGKPVVVGGGTRGVVAAASYEARKYGVRSAMPMSRALRLCPRAVVVAPNRAAYTEASQAVMAILRDVTPLVQPLSLDEAFVDVSAATRAQGRPAVIAAAIRARVVEQLGLTCSVGVAPTKFVAKVASARCKPDGMLVVPARDVLAFLHPLPATALWGVGAKTSESLHRLGIRTVGDLSATPRDTLARAVGAGMAEHLSGLADGIDPRAVSPDDVEKSVSSDHTVDTDLTDEAEVRRELLRLSGDVARRVRERGWAARTVGIKIRFADFTTITRVRTLPSWTDATATIYRTATELYAALDLDRPRIRLVGVKCENLRDAAAVSHQLSFDDLLAAGGAAQPGPDPTTEPITEPTTEPITEPTTESITEPAGLVPSGLEAGDTGPADTGPTDAGPAEPVAAAADDPCPTGPAAARPATARPVTAKPAAAKPAAAKPAAATPRPGLVERADQAGIARTDAVLDAARARFGAGAISFATLLRPPGQPPEVEQLPARDDNG